MSIEARFSVLFTCTIKGAAYCIFYLYNYILNIYALKKVGKVLSESSQKGKKTEKFRKKNFFKKIIKNGKKFSKTSLQIEKNMLQLFHKRNKER